MRAMRSRACLALAVGAVLALSGCTGVAPAARTETPEPEAVAELDCADGVPVAQTLSSGATWSMCWSIDPKRGLVLSGIHLAPPDSAPVSVIASLSLSQLEVPYDDGGRLTSDITSAGFGGTNLKTLADAACAGERLATAVPNIGDGRFGESPVREVVCSERVDGGIAYHSSDPAGPAVSRRTDWQLSTISRVGWYEYVTQYIFGADGSIRVRLGATGDLSPVDHTDGDHGWPVGEGESAHAASHSHNAVWRVHWALGGEGGMAVEQYDAEPTGELGAESPLVEGRLTPLTHPVTAQWTDRRWWRVLAPGERNADGHPISYQIDMEHSDSFTFVADHGHIGEAGYDIAFTNSDPCQLHATRNRGGCGGGVVDFVADAGQRTLDDVVSWVAVGYHHVPRDEDQSPMELHWQGFTLAPRDLTAQRFDVPDGRGDVNGVPDLRWVHEEDLP